MMIKSSLLLSAPGLFAPLACWTVLHVGALFLKDYECPASNTVLYSVPASVEILSASDGYTFITNACEFCEFQSVFCLTYSCYGHV